MAHAIQGGRVGAGAGHVPRVAARAWYVARVHHDSIRPAVDADVPEIIGLIHDLAAYEREPDAVKITEAVLREQLFAEHPRVFATVADAPAWSDHRLAGMALWFLTFSTWEGTHSLYLEDLFVRPELRGRGFGKALLTALAQECVTSGYQRMEWAVLTWNAPSIAFYQSLGAGPMSEWHTYRLAGEALRRLGGAPA